MVEVDNGGMLQALGLVDDGFHHFWMAVAAADGRDSSECVEVAATGGVEQILLLAINHIQLKCTEAIPWNMDANQLISSPFASMKVGYTPKTPQQVVAMKIKGRSQVRYMLR